MSEKDAMNKFDYRLIKSKMRSGIISQKDYEAYLKTLTDDEAKAEYIEVYEEESEPQAETDELGFTFASADSH